MGLLNIIRRMALREKLPLREIARRTGMSRNTIKKYLNAGTIEPQFATPERQSKLDPFAEKLAGWLKTEAAKSRKQRGTLIQRSHQLTPRTIYDWRHYLAVLQRKPGALRNGAPFAEFPPAFKQLQDLMLRKAGGDREMVDILALVLHHDEQAMLVAVEMALAEGVATKTHVLNLLHRLIDGKTIGGPDIDTPQALACAVSQRRMSNAMTACVPGPSEAAMRHDPASGAVIIMLRSLKMHGMAKAINDLMEQGAPAFDAAVPMLAQLLKAEVAEREGRVDRIVVYKIDRLTRALLDFAKIVDRLDGAGASFVSVTQSFNTATGMGRLTLNMLLSFAQFEREVMAGSRQRKPLVWPRCRRSPWPGSARPRRGRFGSPTTRSRSAPAGTSIC